jgi:DNA-binding NtrC family response regulator
MDGRVRAILVYDRPHPLESLKVALLDLSVETCCVRTCQELQQLVPQIRPYLIFTDTELPDGSWADVVHMAGQATWPIDVIVVGAHKDMPLYVSALEGGAFDFVLPPFERQGLDFVVESARHHIHRRTRPEETRP